MATLSDKLMQSREGRRLYGQERLILEVTELICEIMEAKGITRSELAGRLGKSKGWVSQLLDGGANMTLHTIADVFTALDTRLGLSHAPLHVRRRKPVVILPCIENAWATPMTPWNASISMTEGCETADDLAC